MGDLFGGGGGGGDVQAISRLTPEQSALLKNLNVLIGGELGKGMEPYPGEVIPPASDLQTQAFSMLGALGEGTPMTEERANAIMDLLGGTPGFQYDEQAKSDLESYYQTAIVEPSKAEFQDTLDAIAHQYGIRGAAASGSMYSSMAKEANRYQTNLDALKAGLIRGDITASRDSKEAALNRVIGATQESRAEETYVPTALLAGGAQERGIAGEQMSEGVWDWMVSQPAYNPWLGYLGTALGTPAYTFASQPSSAGTGLFGLGAGMQGVSQIALTALGKGGKA
jgi:hypothetical protein